MYTVIIWSLVMAFTALMYRLYKNRRAVRTRLVANDEQITGSTPRENQAHPKPRFSGFIIEPGEDCCQAARELNKITFSLRDIVPLPLPECDKETCTCKKTLVKERRKCNRRFNPDRRNEIRFHFTTGSLDRRIGKGRRQPDKLWSGGYTL